VRRAAGPTLVEPADLVTILTPRDGVVAELPPATTTDGASTTYRFGLADGPLQAYERVVVVAGAPPAGHPGHAVVRQDVELRIGVPFVSWLFALPMVANLGRLEPGGRSPWWAPPQRLPRRAAVTLAALCALSVLVGYLDDVLATTMTYAGREFGVGDGGQGVALGVVQCNAVIALGVLACADRRGRRRVVLVATVAGAALTGLGALSPSLTVLTASQVAAGALLTAQDVLLGIMAIEEMPAGARAWGLALITMCFGLGGGLALLALPLADTGPGGWRWLYALGVLAVPAVWVCARHLPESARWEADDAERRHRPPPPPGGEASGRRWTTSQRRRLLVLGAGALLLALFDAPGGQMQNQYLRTQRHWSATRISVAEQITGTIGGVGTLLGGRLADTHGRRPVAAVAVGLGTAATLVEYFSRGGALYAWMTVGCLLSYAMVPALAVFGGELFPTGRRGRAGGLLTILAAAGGLIGLAGVGLLADAIGSIGPALAVMAVGPLALVVLIVRAYPETAGRRLEDMNPGDEVIPPVR
jgi:MFS family permease